MFNSTDLKQYRALYRKHFGTDITDETARLKLGLLVRQMELIYMPVKVTAASKYVNEDTQYGQIKAYLSE